MATNTEEIVTIKRRDYDRLVKDARRTNDVLLMRLQLIEAIEKEGYIVTTECSTNKPLIFKK